jgi:hypothetical protein
MSEAAQPTIHTMNKPTPETDAVWSDPEQNLLEHARRMERERDEWRAKAYRPLQTAHDLKHAVEESGNDSHFFTRSTMKFFGDRMANYGLRQPVEVETLSGEKVMAYALYRRRPVKHGLQGTAWFHAETFARVYIR